MAKRSYRICLIPGDGIGPEVVNAAKRVLSVVAEKSSSTGFEFDEHRAGFDRFRESGEGLSADTIAAATEADGVLMGAIDAARFPAGAEQPIPILRNRLAIWGSIRPSRTLPGVDARSDNVDLMLVREAREGLYAGLERRINENECRAERVITREASTQVAELAFSIARTRRSKVTAVHKISALPVTDGLFIEAVREVSSRFPDIELEFRNVDACAMELVLKPAEFDVILTTNAFGDILSDVAAGVVGGLGLAASGCIGKETAYFEPVHGTAPDIAGLGIANPMAAILSSAMMLNHLGEAAPATMVEAAVYAVLQDPDAPSTRDLGGTATTDQVTDAVIESLIAAYSS